MRRRDFIGPAGATAAFPHFGTDAATSNESAADASGTGIGAAATYLLPSCLGKRMSTAVA